METYFDHEKLDVYKASTIALKTEKPSLFALFPCLSGLFEAPRRVEFMKIKQDMGR